MLRNACDVDDQVDVRIGGEVVRGGVGFYAGWELVVGESGFALFDGRVADGGDFVVLFALRGDEVGEVGDAALVRKRVLVGLGVGEGHGGMEGRLRGTAPNLCSWRWLRDR